MWDDWRRADGTRTTWHRGDDPDIDSTRWNSRQKKLRHQMAKKSMEIEITNTTDIHNTATFLGSQAFGEKLLRAQTEPQPNWVEETAKLMAKHQEHVHRSGPSAIPAQGSSSSSFSGRSSQRTKTRQQTEASSYATISSATVRGSSKLSARSSVTLGVIPASTPPASSQSVTHKRTRPAQVSLKPQDKQREVPPKDTDIPRPRPLSLKAQGKQLEIVSDFPPSTTRRGLSSSNSSTPPAPFEPNPRKKIKRVIPESDDDSSHSSKNSSSLQPPKRGRPKKMAKWSNEEPSKSE